MYLMQISVFYPYFTQISPTALMHLFLQLLEILAIDYSNLDSLQNTPSIQLYIPSVEYPSSTEKWM